MLLEAGTNIRNCCIKARQPRNHPHHLLLLLETRPLPKIAKLPLLAMRRLAAPTKAADVARASGGGGGDGIIWWFTRLSLGFCY